MKPSDFHPDPDLSRQIDDAISQILRWFRNVYPDPDNIPFYKIDGFSGRPLDSRNLLPELDDYAPFLWILGEKDFVRHQINFLNQRFKSCPFLFRRPQIRREIGIGLPGFLRKRIPHADSQDYVEIFLGLIELYELSSDASFLNFALELWNHFIRHFERDGWIYTWRILPYGPSIPVADAMSGMFIEIAASLSRLTGNTEYLELASKMARRWISTDAFQEFGLFPTIQALGPIRKYPGMQRRELRIELAKANTSVAAGLFALSDEPFRCEFALNALRRWVDGLKKGCLTECGAFSHTPRLRKHQPFGPVLSTNFAVMDILCDLFHLTHKAEFLKLSQDVAAFFMSRQSSATGLFPDEPGQPRSYLDANTDFVISLMKLWELTGESSYHQSASRCLRGVLTYHKIDYGYARDIDMETGSVLNGDVECRFVSLLLKPLILFQKKLQIYGDDAHWTIFRDR